MVNYLHNIPFCKLQKFEVQEAIVYQGLVLIFLVIVLAGDLLNADPWLDVVKSFKENKR